VATYQQVLIASTLADNSIKLCEVGHELATLYKAQLSIVHIVEHLPLMYAGGDFSLPLDPRLETELADEARDKLSKLCQHYGIPQKDQYVIIGDKKEEIKHFVSEHHIDLLILGAHPKHGFDYLLGSTTEGILNKLPCDILAIKIEESS
jgi:universal stress protein A